MHSPAPAALEIEPPDIAPFAKGGSTPFVHELRSGVSGPDVLVTAIVHGNEVSGAWAAKRFLESGLRPQRGRLTIAFANPAAMQRFDRSAPNDSRFVDEDLNRVWMTERLDGNTHSLELDRARELRPFVDRADMLLDLHSTTGDCAPMSLCGPLAKGLNLAKAVGYPETIVIDSGHGDGVRMRDYGRFGDPGDGAASLLVECGQHWKRATAETAYEILLRFLRSCGSIDTDMPARAPQRTLEVTHVIAAETPAFRFVADYAGLDRIAAAGTVIAHDGNTPIATPYDDCVLIMPKHAATAGQTAVRLARECPP